MVASAAALTMSIAACTGDDYRDDFANEHSLADDAEPGQDSSSSELGTLEQGLFGFETLFSSCGDPGGTESVLAALAVSTASELKRWQPTTDMLISNGMLALSSTGKARCSDGKCYNTQALLDLQKDAAASAQVRPGIKLVPSILRFILTTNYNTQNLCTMLSLCKVPAHSLRLLYSEPGGCDTNYYFEALSASGAPLSSASSLKKSLLWADVDVNSYIRFHSTGSVLGIDPTYGLNESGSTTSGTCAAACTKVSSTNLSGQCCSCNGTKSFKRSSWNTSTYLCM